jgi:hypothetical protein
MEGEAMSSDRQELIRRFAVAITQGYWASEPEFVTSPEEVWEYATRIADLEPPQPEPQAEHTREDWWELQGDVKRLTKHVQRLSGTVETLEGRIRRAARLVKQTSHELACGYAVSEDIVDQAVKILEEVSDD